MIRVKLGVFPVTLLKITLEVLSRNIQLVSHLKGSSLNYASLQKYAALLLAEVQGVE